ncbi:MAG: hypothetical protein ACD_37C00436G0003 [uncultured bacterium]|nr:MAG: hypothetical protein ACD_37C00436G0003 [uncultured bacterium]
MKPFRDKHPRRTYVGPARTHYRDYKADLERDFNGRCAYTDCSHIWWADGFHIDHFAPKKPKVTNPARLQSFQDREHVYENLVYACPQVNRAKGNDWPSEDPNVSIVDDHGYFDPCSDFNLYFERTDGGGILPKDYPVANYMWKKLRLYLKRYELYWRIEQIIIRMRELERLRSSLNLPSAMRTEVLESIADLTAEYTKYLSYLDVNYRVLR